MVTGTGTPITIGRNLTRYFVCANAPLVAESTEAYTQIRHRILGVFSALSVVVAANTKDEAATLRFRNSQLGGNGNQVITVPGSTTGTFTDAVNTDSTGGKDRINYSLLSPDEETAGQTIIIGLISIVFSATTNTVVRHAAVNFPDLSDGATTFYSLCGDAAVDDPTDETYVRFDTNAPAFNEYLFVYVSQNLGTVATAVNFRVNGGDYGPTVSITALTTGIFEDTVSSYYTYANDDVNYSVVSANQLAVVIEIISIGRVSTDKTFHSVYSTLSQPFNQTYFMPLGGGTRNTGVEAGVKTPMGMTATVSNLTLLVKSNTITS
jgi:hypothetical protein